MSDRIRKLDGNTKRAVFSRGKATYPMGSPNPNGVNQHKGVKPVATSPVKPKKPMGHGQPLDISKAKRPSQQEFDQFKLKVKTGGMDVPGLPKVKQPPRPAGTNPMPSTNLGKGPGTGGVVTTLPIPAKPKPKMDKIGDAPPGWKEGPGVIGINPPPSVPPGTKEDRYARITPKPVPGGDTRVGISPIPKNPKRKMPYEMRNQITPMGPLAKAAAKKLKRRKM